jgi:acyl-CoA reductase-like NAD-dependent aldehyde dehydrogenase
LAKVIVEEAGIPVAYAQALHVDLPLRFVRYYADLLSRFEFERRQTSAPDAVSFYRLVPAGVAALVVPWNIPITGILAKISPALAAGCTTIVKPSPETPLSAYIFAEAAHCAGVPPGVINVLTADVAGSKHLCAHPGVDMVSFTGSTRTGREIAIACAGSFKKSTLELGGNAAAIVLDDAPIELMAEALAMHGVVMNNGQACVMQRRILVPRHRQAAWVEALSAVLSAAPVGDAADPRTMIGPMISATHRDRVRDYTSSGCHEGASLAVDRNPSTFDEGGFFVKPALFFDVSNDMRIAREEIFGPVACVIPYDDETQAVRIANDTDYGLSGSVWSADPVRATALGRMMRSGSIWINGTLRLDPSVPFGGMRSSGWGRELGPEGLIEFCNSQSLFVPT